VAVIGRQMLRSGTSVAADAREASKTRSTVEFCSKLDGLLQEADKTLLWIELLIKDCGIIEPPLAALHREFDQITAIFTTIVAKSRKLP
jgi:four helix bundle protein